MPRTTRGATNEETALQLTLVTPGYAADEEDHCIPALRTLVRALAERHRVTVLALRYPGAPGDYRLDGASVTALGGGQAFGWRRLALLDRAARWLRARAASGGVDLVHALWADEPGFLATSLHQRAGVPALVSLLGGELARLPAIGYGHQLFRVPRWLIARALRRAPALTAGSPWLLERLDRHRRSASRAERSASRRIPSLHLAPLPVEPRFAGPPPRDGVSPLAGGRPRILSVASLTPVKGHAHLLTAFAATTSALPRATLHLVGEGPGRAELESRAGELGIGSRVVFHGQQPHARLVDFYRAADFCVLASEWESQSMVALEAAASGRVTVGSAVGMLPELAPPELLAPPCAIDSLTMVLTRAGRQAASWESWGAEARDRALENASVEAALASFATAYAAAMGDHSPLAERAP